MEQEERSESKRQKVMERELAWVRMGQKARQAKSKARITNYEKMLAEEEKVTEDKLDIYIPPGPRLGAKVIEANNVCQGLWRQIVV
jgi:sulfate-transporting ATPase